MEINFDVSSLKESYLVSNTASFLFQRFSQDENIVFLAQEYEVNALIKIFNNIAQNEINSVDDLVKAYGLYIAILMKDDIEVDEFLSNIGKIDFEWFEELRSIYFSRSRPDVVIKLNNISKPSYISRFETEGESNLNSHFLAIA